MDGFHQNRKNRYDRVMSRISNQARSTSKSSSFVTRHDIPSRSSVRVGAKPSVSNVSSSVFSDLPTVLNDYVPDINREKVRRTLVKPRKTVKSLDPALSPPRTVTKPKLMSKKPSNIHAPDSAPSVLPKNGEQWSDTHLRQCFSSRSHSRLKELKDEIHAYQETEKLMRIRSSLYKKCGVVLDDVGNLATDKAVQVDEQPPVAHDTGQTAIRRFQWLKAIGRRDLLNVSYKKSKICSKHFRDDEIRMANTRRRLIRRAVPSLWCNRKIPYTEESDSSSNSRNAPPPTRNRKRTKKLSKDARLISEPVGDASQVKNEELNCLEEAKKTTINMLRMFFLITAENIFDLL